MSRFDYFAIIEQNNIPCSIEKGIDGKHYAVFCNNYAAEEYDYFFNDCPIVCFGQYDNAFLFGVS